MASFSGYFQEQSLALFYRTTKNRDKLLQILEHDIRRLYVENTRLDCDDEAEMLNLWLK